MPLQYPVALPSSSAMGAPDVATLGYGMAVRAVVAGDVVVVAQRGARADRHGFLSNVAVGHAHQLAPLD